MRAAGAWLVLVLAVGSCKSRGLPDNGGGAGSSGPGGSAAGTAGAGGGGGTGGSTGTGGAGAVVDAAVESILDGSGAVDVATMEGGCAASIKPATLLVPNVLILLDRSGSMNEDINNATCQNGCGATSKWALMAASIKDVVSSTETTINWGLKYFANNTGCGVDPGAAVPVGNGNASAIAAAIDAETSANGGVVNGSRTPTRVAENSAAAYLSNVAGAGPRFILLATDGLPNCAPGSSDTAAADDMGSILAVEEVRKAGIPTFVVGVATAGTGIADMVLSAMASAGGVARAGTPSYYSASSASELITGLREIAGRTSSCTFAAGALPDGADRNAMTVEGDGVAIARDTSHVDGWDLIEGAGIVFRIYGPRCAAIMGGTLREIAVHFPCYPEYQPW